MHITPMQTLEDKIVTTLGTDRFLVASQEHAHAIADIADKLGAETMAGLVNWFLSRTDETFVNADTLLTALRAGLHTSALVAA